MRILVESLKRLYENGRVTKAQLQKRVEKKILTIDEYNYIVRETEKTEPEQSEE